jgi:hypothetical protein
MATIAQNNVQYVLVGGTAAKTASGTVNDANTGEICVVGESGQILTETTAATATRFALGLNRGGEPHVVTPFIKPADVTGSNAQNYVAATEQLSYIGYNGVSGSIEVNNSALYYVRLYLEDLFARSSEDGKRMKFGAYKSTTAATQEAIARGITDSLIRNFSRQPEREIKFERICDEAGVALGTAVGPLTFTNGSKFFTADDINDATTNAALAVGDFIRAGTGLTDPVYEITAVNGDIGTLDIAFQGTTLTAVADTSFERITNATALAAEWGVKLTGLPLEFKLGKIQYKKTRFTVQVDHTEGFVDTPITLSAAASPGNGVYERVAEMEWFAQGHEGEFFRMGEPDIFDQRKDAVATVAGGGYDQITLSFKNDEVVGLGSLTSSKAAITLAVPATIPAYITGTDDVTDVLEVLLFGSATGALSLA